MKIQRLLTIVIIACLTMASASVIGNSDSSGWQDEASSLYASGDYTKAYKQYVKQGKKGDRFSQYRLSYMHLKGLGAKALVPRSDLSRDCKPMERETWAGVVDTVGDKVLATAIAQTRYEGVVTACGLAGGAGLPTSVMPFILRGVTLRGVDSVMASQARRQRAWDALAEILDREQLREIYQLVPLSKVPDLAGQIVKGQVRGRLVVDVNA